MSRRILNLIWNVAFALRIEAGELFVSPNSPSPAPPYDTWQNAAHDIQTAVDFATPFDTVFVSNGIYQTGGRLAIGVTTNRIVIPANITLKSINGAAVTIIRGSGPVGPAAIRCLYLSSGATIDGFTLENGHTRDTDNYNIDQSGGGVWCESDQAVVQNCVIKSCRSGCYGGGAYEGTYRNCVMANNYARYWGGAAVFADIYGSLAISNNAGSGGGAFDNCVVTDTIIRKNWVTNIAGGVYATVLRRCIVEQNTAKYGGGAAQGTSYETIFRNNSASQGAGAVWYGTHYSSQMNGNSALFAGAAYGSSLENCTVVYNVAGHSGGGIEDGGARNSIVWSNSAPIGPNWFNSGMSFCCTFPGQDGESSVTNDPNLVTNNVGIYLLYANSPCVDAGTNQAWMNQSFDIEGQIRVNNIIDIGADEAAIDLTMFTSSNTLTLLLKSPPGTTSELQRADSLPNVVWLNTSTTATGPSSRIDLEITNIANTTFYRTLKM